jgi:hypothetical protein
MNKIISNRNLTITALIAVAIIGRFVPHAPNFTPLGATALFAAAFFGNRWLAFLVPFVVLLISNLILDNVVYAQEAFVWFGDYTLFQVNAFVLVVLAGRFLLQKVNIQNVFVASLSASMIFFLVSNFGAWLSHGVYPLSTNGLLAAYTAGIPFFWNTLAGDLVYSAMLFGAYALIKVKLPKLVMA